MNVPEKNHGSFPEQQTKPNKPPFWANIHTGPLNYKAQMLTI
jgi:hypothetical protein